jgi:lipid A 4'-phosphatase
MTETLHGRNTRSTWLAELLVLLAVAIAATVPFWLTDLDLEVAARFWRPEEPTNPWPYADWWLWDFFYRTIPLFTAVLAFGALVVLAFAAFRPHMARARLGAGVLLLTIIVGPGLLVNAIFKENWGRPRPRQTVELGGTMAYQPPLQPAFDQNGKSFPCGHCAAAFSLLALWFLFRRRRALAWISLIGVLTLGGLVGVARMAAGGHFLSDVVWAALLTFFAVWLSYYWIIDVPRRERRLLHAAPTPSRHPYLVAAAYGSLGLLILLGALLDTPLRQDLSYRPNAAELTTAPRDLAIATENVDVEIRFVAGDMQALRIEGRVRGFGLPWSGVEARVRTTDGESPTLRYTLVKRGLVKELGGTLQVQAPLSLEEIRVEARDAAVRVGEVPEGMGTPEVKIQASGIRR